MKATDNVFPYETPTAVYTGLTVRDYIAIQAMVGLSANPQLTDRSFGEMADMAYKQADAMLTRSEASDVN